MEHTFGATVLLLAVCAALSFGAAALAKPAEEPTPAAEVYSVPEEEKSMTLGVFEGKLALFIGQSPYPNAVYDFLIRTLPPEDRTRLEAGIELSGEEELYALLEDYMS